MYRFGFVSGYAGKFSAVIRFKTALRTDERVRFMDEIISGVPVIKMYAWEKLFSRLVAIGRRLELQQILKNGYVRALYMTFSIFTTRMALFCTVLSVFLIYGRENIKVSQIFMISYLFTAISQAMCRTFVRGVAEMGEALVALKRLQMFLQYEEKARADISTKTTNNDQLEFKNLAILLENVSAGWRDQMNDSKKSKHTKKVDSYESDTQTKQIELEPFKLKNIDLEVSKGKIIFVIGSIGAGKSTFLQVLLQELPLIGGSLGINGKISYASQESWIFTSTVRQNIIFGETFDGSRYNEVVESTALSKDFSQLSSGDLTLVGENGTGLSGGQKTRLNLARALYRKADIYLLDDPLSAVDAQVQSHLFNNCIGPQSFLARQNATRILVTHQAHFLKEADWIMVLKDVTISEISPNNDEIKINGRFFC